jgi:hypothetical protein
VVAVGIEVPSTLHCNRFFTTVARTKGMSKGALMPNAPKTFIFLSCLFGLVFFSSGAGMLYLAQVNAPLPS